MTEALSFPDFDQLTQDASQQGLKKSLSAFLNNATLQLDNAFRNGTPIRKLIQARAKIIDQLLTVAWQQLGFDEEISLIAVGGYGRGELHPQSDIDLLLLLSDANAEKYQTQISELLTLLWDLKLNVGHSVRTPQQCAEIAAHDITVVTSLMECRTLCGNEDLRAQMLELIAPENIWNAADFFIAKRDEQSARHKRHGINEYDLEPNIKESPGGLRDIHTIIWVAKRYFRADSVAELRHKALFSDQEYRDLRKGEELLWRVRYGAHLLAGRPQEKLQFDHQRELAELFGYEDNDERLAVEQFMQHYYRTVMQLRLINEVLMRHLEETILGGTSKEPITPINKQLQCRGRYLEVTHKRVFLENPSTLLEIFLEYGKNADVEGIRASTIRLIHSQCDLIDENFRADPNNRSLFMQIFQLTYRLSTTLQRMTRYGVLGKYLPEFDKIIGQMQHDLFHIYPVDVHTLQVLKNIRRLGRTNGQKEFPMPASVFQKMERKELVLIAALYHDIAKGRGGCHSTLGAVDIRNFAEHHGFTKREVNLLAWLVQNHLLMSQTSQKQDLTDPEVINKFAVKVQDMQHLDMLYVLTVADINATNPSLWNSWKASLMNQLYLEASKAFARGLENPADRKQRIKETREEALDILAARGFTPKEVFALWSNLGDDYFLRESAIDIAWHTEAIDEYNSDQPLILIRSNESNAAEGVTQIFIRTLDRDHTFAAIAAALDQVHLSIHDARLYTSAGGYTLDTFYVLDHNDQPIGHDEARFRLIRETINKELDLRDNYSDIVQRRTPRQLKHFPIATSTRLSHNLERGHSILEVTTADRAGLLASIGRIFVEFGIRVQNARIATLGERVEDIFFITDQSGSPLINEELAESLQQQIRQRIDQHI
ncbi:[protein-PII] uridylyltransferase [Porticoccaceae bacterium LTM1]|nr:[protein-PII] uridylyltransferase [Porticoccaceae bacterium LTM1]